MSRWLLEPKAGVFVGDVSALVRDKLWDKTCKALKAHEACIRIYSSNTEQGFVIESSGKTTRRIVDYEGLKMVATQKSP